MINDEAICCCLHDSPIGPLLLGARSGKLTFLYFPKDGKAREIEPGWSLDPDGFKMARRQLDGYFAGTLEVFSLPYQLEGTVFQRAVWAALVQIPFGSVRSYGDIAKAIGQPGAARAVGLANNANPLPIIVPCHRVIGSDGSLVGFGGGLDLKMRLLQHEGIDPGQIRTPGQMTFGF
ncbi:methylated-DNA-[protein]-cysteine S-methyltransferase [Cohaesibacter sp. ES.047]|uniref:methylated-DNA--[protein]-cysteine S-methyltransferase n=1 Tax=Cohaesibacter sp. ES.047 TaxID=1798205 RepID=UPI000BB981A0|nr:methylated-DNA--[protein]-cysteine S-methyltransferase [Cohaesibacter sp. ES.047]SNY90462.1 methylated-DNA-[protein]-cysteine S-methyltransferase [Cohaesibacter sp. ES.047]